MKLKFIKCFIILLSHFLTINSVNAEESQKQTELGQLRSKIDNLKHDIEQKEGSRHATLDALKQSEQEISRINRKLFELERQQSTLDNSLVGLLNQSQTARGSIQNHQKYLAFWIKQKYMNNTPEITQLLFRKRKTEELIRHLHYYSYLAQSHSHRIQQLKSSLDQYRNLSTQTRAKYYDLDKITSEQKEQKDKLQAELKNRNRLLAQVSTEIQSQKTKLDSLLQNEKRLGDLVDGLAISSKKTKELPKQEEVKNPIDLAKKDKENIKKSETKVVDNSKKTFKNLQGNLKFPVANGVVKNKFGSPRDGTTWKGWFIGAKDGETITAVADGKVTFAEWVKGFGNLIILDHGDNYLSLYANNEGVVRNVGDEVKAGDKIAIIGSTGGNSESGVYFELRHEGKPVNPSKWIAGKH